MTPNTTLRDRLIETTVAMRGVDTHLDLARLISEAECFRLADAASGSLARAIETATASIEENMDLIRFREDGIWIEFEDQPRRGDVEPIAGSVHPCSVGIFACPDPTDFDRIIMMTAWDLPDGTVHHSFAAIAMSVSDISERAYLARNRYGKGQLESIARMIDMAVVYHPAGFKEEVIFASSIDVGAMGAKVSFKSLEDARRDVVLELPFALAALLLVTAAQNTHSWSEQDKIWEVDIDAPNPGFLDKIGLGRFNKNGFRRRGDPRQPMVSYRPV